MKKLLFIASIFAFVFLGLLFPRSSSAANGADCAAAAGHCTPVVFNCGYGSELSANDCGTLLKCCPNKPQGSGLFGSSPAPQDCSGGQGFLTAIGCIPVENPQAFASYFLRWGMGVAGGIALLLIGVAGFMIITSEGNPQRLQTGKDMMTAAISGIVLLLFGVFALRLIGVDILKIPGFGV